MPAFALIAAALLAQAHAQLERAPPARGPPPATRDGGGSRAPLSREDDALIKQLALLEKVEFLQNLELFEEPKGAPKPPAPQP